MPTLPRPIEEHVRHMQSVFQRAATLLISHPAIFFLAMGAWGVEVLGEYIVSLTFIGLIVTYVLSPAFFGVVAERHVPDKPNVTKKLIGASIRRLALGHIVITMVYALPFLIVTPLVNAALGLDLEGVSWVPVLTAVPIVVPSIAAIWSLAYRRTPLAEAIVDGVSMLRGRWGTAILLGLAYQLLAWGAKALRIKLIAELDPLLALIVALVWAAIEGIFRLTVLLWLFGDVPTREPKRRRKA